MLEIEVFGSQATLFLAPLCCEKILGTSRSNLFGFFGYGQCGLKNLLIV